MNFFFLNSRFFAQFQIYFCLIQVFLLFFFNFIELFFFCLIPDSLAELIEQWFSHRVQTTVPAEKRRICTNEVSHSSAVKPEDLIEIRQKTIFGHLCLYPDEGPQRGGAFICVLIKAPPQTFKLTKPLPSVLFI